MLPIHLVVVTGEAAAVAIGKEMMVRSAATVVRYVRGAQLT